MNEAPKNHEHMIQITRATLVKLNDYLDTIAEIEQEAITDEEDGGVWIRMKSVAMIPGLDGLAEFPKRYQVAVDIIQEDPLVRDLLVKGGKAYKKDIEKRLKSGAYGSPAPDPGSPEGIASFKRSMRELAKRPIPPPPGPIDFEDLPHFMTENSERPHVPGWMKGFDNAPQL